MLPLRPREFWGGFAMFHRLWITALLVCGSVVRDPSGSAKDRYLLEQSGIGDKDNAYPAGGC